MNMMQTVCRLGRCSASGARRLRIAASSGLRILAVDIIAMLLFCLGVLAGPSNIARAESGLERTDISRIPVFVEYPADSQIKIEQLYGPVTVLPPKTQGAPDAFGKYVFDLDFSSSQVKNGNIFKYRVTELPGADGLISYNAGNKVYIAEVWVVDDAVSGLRHAQTILYEGVEPLPGGVDDSVTKLDKCNFRNEKIIVPPPVTPSTPAPEPTSNITPSALPPATVPQNPAASSGKTPFTGDTSETLMYSVLLAVGAAGIIAGIISRRRYSQKSK